MAVAQALLPVRDRIVQKRAGKSARATSSLLFPVALCHAAFQGSETNMKPAHIAIVVWCFNLALLAAAVPLVLGSKSTADMQRGDVEQQPVPMARVNWQNTAQSNGSEIGEPQLSMRARSQPVVEKLEVKIDPPVDPTDDELRAELQAALNRRYVLQRTITWVVGDEKPGAFVLCAGTKLFVFEGMNLKDLKGVEASARADIDVKAIAVDHVVVNAASTRVPSKRFDVKLEFGKESATAAFRWMGSVKGGIEIIPPPAEGEFPFPVDPVPADSKPTQPGDQFSREQAEKVFNETVAHVRVLDDGLMLTETLPEDSELIKQGARRGDILKSINGQSVRSMSDVRRVVRTEHDSGIREFKVAFERDGIPQTKLIKLK